MSKNIDYQQWLLKELKNPDMAIAYLTTAFEESLKGDEESQHLFLVALRNVANAHDGIGNLTGKTGVDRENLYKTLSEKVMLNSIHLFDE